MRQAINLLGQPLDREGLKLLDYTRVQHPPTLLQQTTVGHLVRQGVLEGEFTFGEQPRLVEELGRLQVCKAAIQVRLGQLGNNL